MSLIIPTGFVQAVYQFEMSPDPEVMVITCGHEVDSASGATYANSADDLFNAFATHMMPELSTALELVAVTTYGGNDASTPVVTESTETPVSGGNSAATVPNNTAFLVRKRTDLAGRRGRGRMYIPGVYESVVNHVGELSELSYDAWQLVLADWYEALTSAVGARYYPPVVLHRSEGAGVEPPPTPVTSFQMDRYVATQRRRMRP